MAKTRGVNQKSKYAALNKRLQKYVALVQSVYDTCSGEAARIALRTDYSGEEPFSFRDYPETKGELKKLMQSFTDDIKGVIYSGTSAEWKESNMVQDLLANKVLKSYDAIIDGKKQVVYYQQNNDALKAFQSRKDKGLGLSQKVWNQSKELKLELESAISVAIEKGTSAVTLSKRISKYLSDFPSLKKDYKEKYGVATNCHDCEYRSIRLARSEINMAYRTAEQTRWKQFDFVLGYEIKLSGSHPKTDICDMLAGKYPKDFVWTGWHPNDLCYCIPILKTEEEFWNDDNVHEIMEPPTSFTKWIEDNAERISNASKNDTLPYWYKQNDKYVDATYWRNWERLLQYDDTNREYWQRVQKWKEGLGIDTSRFDTLMRTKDVRDTQLDGELFRLVSKIEDEKDRFSDEWTRIYYLIYSDDAKSKHGKLFLNQMSEELNSVPRMLQYDVDTSWKSLRAVEDKMDKHEALMSNGIVDVVSPSFKSKSAGMKTIGAPDVTVVRDQLNALVGNAKYDRYGFLRFRDEFDKMVTSGVVDDKIRLEFIEMLDRDEGAVWKCIDHLNEIAKATDLKKIPKRWRQSFNKYMEDIRLYDIDKNGYEGVYIQIEAAYNIYRLSTSPTAIKYGLKNISEKTPWNLFEVFAENGIDLKYLPNNRLFSYEDDFVPWYDGIRQNREKDFHIYSSAHYSTRFKHVSINRKFFDQVRGRCAGNMYEVSNIFYHEYGHALDDQRDWIKKKKIADLFGKYSAKYNAMMPDEIKEMFGNAKTRYIKKRFDEGAEADLIYGTPSDERYSNVSDVIQALRSDHLEIYGGHGDKYYYMIDKNGDVIFDKDGIPLQNIQAQLSEFVAHMNEAYWRGNLFWELFDKDLYDEVREIMRIAYRGRKDALN